MKISGFTLIRNGVEFDYPFMESIESLLPFVDEMIVNVGRGTDQTLDILKALSLTPQGSKIKLFESDWPLGDPEKKKGGLILSEQTNLALERCSNDWCFYLQADEVLDPNDQPNLVNGLKLIDKNPAIEGVLFQYVHFYGSFDVVQDSRSAYRREVRLIRKSSGAISVGDAQSFRKPDGQKLKVIRCNATVYHYGWVRPPAAMREKTYFFDQLYHGTPKDQDAQHRRPHTGDNYQYRRFWGLRRYRGSHPSVMKKRIESKGWHWDLKKAPWTWQVKDASKIVLDSIEKITGIRLFEYQSYLLIKTPWPSDQDSRSQKSQ